MSAQSRPYPLVAAGSGAVYTGQCSLRGFWLVTSAAATVTIYDGVTAAGTVLAQWTTAATGADKAFDFADGIRCETGIYVNVSTGNVTGNVRVG
jgi:hypothetical protein